ncbi:Histone-lysine N-methyltransferase ATXR3 [Capsicum annuum]|uniref:Histone-lysine N-methyltransferase ATXR3 n=1 Tax=Capsicum annuum TaxID=4072 RepID=A0A1U8HBE3_CAPAN|nr:histone-lysine N-methyltransferase ATXR3 [Capsicum annuum]KAF3682584.1 Histone-lysine N-methyltransferase ATXR3 [Capsicum annuum]PHT76166.1 Histone-lysine N-methyltransferase ATXR3 [Capsicum annuum]
MGDGGVACVSVQHIMERFSVCGGKNMSSNTFSTTTSMNSTTKKATVKKKMKKVNGKMKVVKKGKGVNLSSKSGVKEIECNGDVGKDEVEEGELGTLPFENGQLVSEKALPRRCEIKSEIEKAEIKSEVKRSEFGKGRWRKVEWEKGDYISGKFNRKGEVDKNVPGYEPGEFVPDRWRKGEGSARDDFNYNRTRRYDFGKDKGWKGDLEWTPPSAKDKGWRNDHEWTPPSAKDKGWRNDREWTPPSAKDKGWRNDHEWTPPTTKDKGWRNDREWTPPSSGKHSGEKDIGRSGGIQHVKRLSRYEPSIPERTPRISSKIVGEEGPSKSELRNGNNPSREYFSGNRLKRHVTDSDKSDRKYRGEYDDFSSSKSRKLSDDGSRAVYATEHGLRRSTEKLHKNVNRNIPPDRYSSRHYETSKVSYDRLNSSPRHSERSPRDRARHLENWDRSPARREKSPYDRGRHFDSSRSPYDRSRHYDNRSQSPSYSEWSPQDQGRHHHRRDRTPNFIEQPQRDRRWNVYRRDPGQKSGPNDKKESNFEGKKLEGKFSSQKDVSGKDQIAKDSEVSSCPENSNCSIVKSGIHPVNNEDLPQCPAVNALEPSEENGAVEEVASMEEDMDICNTPPHVSVVAEGTIGKWYYLDQFGVEQGPSRLCKLKSLVEEGYIVADHFVKHTDSERWVTVENAVSPMAAVNFPSVVPDVVAQMVSPPEAPGNVLEDNYDLAQLNDRVAVDASAPSSEIVPCHADSLDASEPLDEHHIDERVGALLEGFSVTPGRELEVIGEVLQMTFEHVEWEKWGSAEGEHYGQSSDECLLNSEAQKEPTEPRTRDKENDFFCSDSAELFSGLWSCKGGDWKRNDEATQDRLWKKKLVLNDGYPLCLMSKSGIEDRRWLQKDESNYPSHSRRLDLPSWAFTPDEWNDSSVVVRPNPSKPPMLRGTKGIMLPVIRINACVVNEHGSFVSEPHTKVRAKDRHPQRSSRPYVATGDTKRLSEEGAYRSQSRQDLVSHSSRKSSTPLNIPKDRLCSVDELQLHLGEWYYLDGAGHERGPFSFIELQVLVDQGVIPENSSAFRKLDRTWVPVASSSKTSDMSKVCQTPNEPLGASMSELESSLQSVPGGAPCTFHGMHPQFIGYTQGKLHELVMKSYKSRELAAAINEVLDPWINARQPKKECNPDFRASKKARCHGSEEESEMEEDIAVFPNDECQFDDLCCEEAFNREAITKPGIENGSWGLLDDRVLARIFHFLKADVKSLVYAALTCTHWRSIVKIYKGISRQVDLLSIASSCTDSVLQKIMSDYNKERLTSLGLRDCIGITPRMLEDVLLSFSCLSSIDIRGCSQLEDVAVKFPNINWIRSRSSNLKVKSLKNVSDRTSSSYRTYSSQENQTDDSIGLRDYLESSDKREFANQLFRRSLYKRAKVFDARKSSSMLSRDAQLRHLAMRKSRNCFKRMKEFLASSLREIMQENTFEFFVPKVGEIEEKIKSGYYASRGLNSAKEDISRMCRDALKSKKRGDAKDMNRIIASFIRLATRLEEDPTKSVSTRDEMMNTWNDDSPPGFSSSTTKYKKNPARMSEKKYFNRSNGSSYANGVSDCGEFASDREIKRRLSKLRLKSLDSGSETSDDLDRSSDDTSSDSESSASDTESDLDLRSESGAAESKDYFTPDDGFDSLADDREWGARMTKASLVPPVTRKYEVVDHYVIVADEKEVKRKMLVSLPEDYAEKLSAQKNGTEESDMEIPEVKDYKPRKTLGEEVIEQEVYGIDPYTHNLLLDSMPDESDWSLLDKHLFIEDVLLCTLNKQVRRFTGSHTPMIYSLKPVFEEILENAEKDQDKRTVRLCQFILKAIDTRPEDNYVAYRKGLGVVCNKEGGFSEEDFVVEFLGEVYPAWKWFEKQDGIRSLQRNNNDPAPEFYNIYLERPKGDADGYDLVVVDAMHKANYASRICHSCRPNCEAKVTAVDGQYQIGIYSVRPIAYGEEVTFDYNSVTESKEEYEASVCLCGSQVCRGSYLNLTGEGAFLKVLQEYHGLLDRHQLMLEASELNSVSEEDYIDLGKAGLGSCLLAGLPHWLIAYSARLVRFINFERTKLPDEILKHNLEEKKKYFSDICLEVEKNESEIQAEGVYNQRLQNLALTLDKVRYVMRCVFGDPEKAPPPIERLNPEDAVSFIWRGEGSLVDELLQCMAPHLEDSMLSDLKAKIRAHDPSRFEDLETGLRKSLLWLRDEVRDLPCTYKSRHDAAADLIHLYAYTKCFFRIREYKTVTSPPVYISPLDLGPKYADKLGPGIHEYRKTYGENYCLGQLFYWYNQANADPENCLFKASRGCLSLPEAGSFYAKVQKPSRQRVYGPRTVKFMLSRMEKQPQRAWPKDRIWSFKSSPKVFGSPMLDGILNKAPLEKEMVHWLKHRPAIFQAKWDR